MYEEVTFERDCRAIVIPDGVDIEIPEGMMGYITQVLGGNYTIQVATGYLVRVDARDADAIGKEVEAPPEPEVDDEGHVVVDDQRVWEQLTQIYDPEIPVNIVELGLVYDLDVETVGENAYKVGIRMTLTAPGCGMGEILRNDVDYRVRNIPGVKETDIELVFDPPWTPEKMTEAARLELGLI
ncbi:MAG: putative Fe-S cluster assembly protein SufT [Myxococcota bacterium]